MSSERDIESTHRVDDARPAGSRDRVGRGPEDVIVEQLAPAGWRVRDIRLSEHDRNSMLGFIEKENDLFEVMQLGVGFQLLTFTSFDTAVEYLTKHVPEPDELPNPSNHSGNVVDVEDAIRRLKG